MLEVLEENVSLNNDVLTQVNVVDSELVVNSHGLVDRISDCLVSNCGRVVNNGVGMASHLFKIFDYY